MNLSSELKIKLLFTFLTTVWLVGFIFIDVARDVYAHYYMHNLPLSISELSWSTKNIALPVLTAFSFPTRPQVLANVFWGFIWFFPIIAVLYIWLSCKTQLTVLKAWVIGMSLYSMFLFASLFLIGFSLWLPFRSS